MFIDYNPSGGPVELSSESIRTDASSEAAFGGDSPQVLMVPHVLMIPDPSFLRIALMFRVAEQMVSRTWNIKISILSFTSVINSLNSTLTNLSRRIHFLKLNEPSFPVASHDENCWLGLEDKMRELEEASDGYITKWKLDKEEGVLGGPTFLISDMLHWWTNKISTKLEIPRFVLCSISACSLALALAFREVEGFDKLASRDSGETDVEKIQVDNLPMFTINEMCMSTPQFVENVEKSVGMATGIILNSFEELEEQALSSIRKRVPDTCEVLPIGPILIEEPDPPVYSDNLCVTGKCLEYLETTRGKKWVVYVNLRPSDTHRLSTKDFHQLAFALEDSLKQFLWVLPDFVQLEEVLPEGFQHRARNRGFVIRGWVSQKQILSHRSIAAFLTYGDWNSCLHCITTGVPIIALPSSSDRQHNTKYFADTLKVALQVVKRQNYVAHRLDVLDSIFMLFMTGIGFLLNHRGMNLKVISMIVNENEGSSYQNVGLLLRSVIWSVVSSSERRSKNLLKNCSC